MEENKNKPVSLNVMLLTIGAITVGVMGLYVFINNMSLDRAKEAVLKMEAVDNKVMLVEGKSRDDGFEIRIRIDYAKEIEKVPSAVADYVIYSGRGGSYVMPSLEITLNEQQRGDKELMERHAKFIKEMDRYKFSVSQGTVELSKMKTNLENDYNREVLEIGNKAIS